MEYCKRCGSLWMYGKCSNAHCGKHVRMWAESDPDYNCDLKEMKPLIHATRYNSPLVQSMGLHQQVTHPKMSRLGDW